MKKSAPKGGSSSPIPPRKSLFRVRSLLLAKAASAMMAKFVLWM